jgi:hypothetical protein
MEENDKDVICLDDTLKSEGESKDRPVEIIEILSCSQESKVKESK